MRRFLCLLLILCLLLTGCSVLRERIKEPVTFYYLRSQIEYFTQDGVIASEEREASGHRDDLSYLMALYLMGPAEEDLKSPIPRGTRIYKAIQDTEGVTLHLSDTVDAMDDIEFSLACTCLSLTCFDLTDTQAVTIQGGDRTFTISRDTLTLYDGSTAAAGEETE